jgi:spore coat polysaccharide biosynthesis predicted glycosyltransferase SpsG
MKANIALRVDANRSVGLGHLGRMQAIAFQLDALGYEYKYLCNLDSYQTLLSRGIDAQHVVIVNNDSLPSGYTHWLGDICYSGNTVNVNRFVSQVLATPNWLGLIDSMPPDHFTFSSDLVRRLPNLLVTPYYQACELRSEPAVCTWKAGAQYAIFSQDYIALRKNLQPPEELRILVTCGGSDPTDLSLRIALALKNTRLPVTIVVGPLYSTYIKKELQKLARQNPLIELSRPLMGLASEVHRASHVIGRVGLIRYETAVLGRYGLFLSEGSEYRDYLHNFNESRASEIYFALDSGGEKGFLDRVREIGKSNNKPILNEAGLAISDGKGSLRILKQLNL